MRSERKRIIKRRNKQKRRLFFTVIFTSIFFCSALIYGEGVFYAAKTLLYKNQALKIDIKSEKSDDLKNINLNFMNEGTCDVYLRGFIFVYSNNNSENGTTLSNSTVIFNYGDEDFWYVGEDNYVYYTKPLQVGSKTEIPMVTSIYINLSEDDKLMLGEGELGVDIVMESVQVNNFAYKYQWDMSNVELEELFKNEGHEKVQILDSEGVIKLKFE